MSKKNIAPSNLAIILKYIILSLALISTSYASDTGFSKNINFIHNNQHLTLFLTGSTIRQKFFLDIYSMAHYVEKKTHILTGNIYKNIYKNSGAKQITMVFLRNLSSDQIQKSLIEGIKLNTTNDEYLQIQPQVKEFMQAIYKDIDQNDRFIIRWLSDDTLVSIFKGKQVSAINNVLFAKTLWSIWLGDQSIVNREILINKLLTSS